MQYIGSAFASFALSDTCEDSGPSCLIRDFNEGNKSTSKNSDKSEIKDSLGGSLLLAVCLRPSNKHVPLAWGQPQT